MQRIMTTTLAAALLASGGLAPLAAAETPKADSIKIGFIGTLSGPGGVTGTQARDAFALALEQHGGKLGGLPATLLAADDQQKPEIGRQLVEKFIEADHVDLIVTGTFSNVMLAMAPVAVQAKTILFSMVAGPSQLAGKECSPYFFNTSWQGDNYAEAMGAFLQRQGVQDIYLMAPNYAAGHDVITGFKREFHGRLAGERFTPLTQMDFAAELADIRAQKPAAVFAFYPGGLGIQFVKQYAQSGMTLPLYTSYTIDEASLPALGEAAMGRELTTFWSSAMDNPANRAFVASFTAKYGYGPAYYAAQGFDTANLLDSAVTALDGRIADRGALISAIEHANFASVRGNFHFANDHFPIQDFYIGKVVAGADGKPTIKLGEAVLKNHGNAYQADCAMK